MFLYTCFIACIFAIIAFVFAPSKSEIISGFPDILLPTRRTCEKKNQTVIIPVEFIIPWFIFKLSTVAVLVNMSVSSIFKQTSHLDLPHFSVPTFSFKG